MNTNDINKAFTTAHEEVSKERERKKSEFMKLSAEAAERRRHLTELDLLEKAYMRDNPPTDEEKIKYKEVLKNLSKKNKTNTEE